MGNVSAPIAFASVQDTVDNTVHTLVNFGFTQAQVDLASEAIVFVNTQAIRIDYSGNSPTTTSGLVISSASHSKQHFVIYSNENIQKLKIIRDGSNSSEVFIILSK